MGKGSTFETIKMDECERHRPQILISSKLWLGLTTLPSLALSPELGVSEDGVLSSPSQVSGWLWRWASSGVPVPGYSYLASRAVIGSAEGVGGLLSTTPTSGLSGAISRVFHLPEKPLTSFRLLQRFWFLLWPGTYFTGSSDTPPGGRYNWRPTDHSSKYWNVISQANKLN